MLLDSLILSQKMRHVKFNFIQCKIATCSPSSGCANCCKIGPTYPQLGTGFAFVDFMVLLVFGFSSCAGLALPKTIHCHCCKTCFFLVSACLKMRWPFSIQRNHFGVKKGHFMLGHTNLLIYCFGRVFVASILCWLAPSKTYPTEIYRFTLAQKAHFSTRTHFRPAYIKRKRHTSFTKQ